MKHICKINKISIQRFLFILMVVNYCIPNEHIFCGSTVLLKTKLVFII